MRVLRIRRCQRTCHNIDRRCGIQVASVRFRLVRRITALIAVLMAVDPEIHAKFCEARIEDESGNQASVCETVSEMEGERGEGGREACGTGAFPNNR